MPQHKPHPANEPGEFYVEEGCCTMCEVPFVAAPGLFGVGAEPHCFVKRQPITVDELDQMVNAIQHSETMCIRYRGGDRRIQPRQIKSGEKEVCDHLPRDLK